MFNINDGMVFDFVDELSVFLHLENLCESEQSEEVQPQAYDAEIMGNIEVIC